MAKPRIFVSSTYYDLKYIRASLDLFIESLGFEPVLSEKGDIAFAPDLPLDESCYREASSTDIFVLIIGGRYGSKATKQNKQSVQALHDQYDSITKREFETASARNIPTYILIEASVYAEYQTYGNNKNNKRIKDAHEKIVYAHVDSPNVFKFIDEVFSKQQNNPVQTFEKFADIEGWLREQWAGLFRELLNRQSQQEELATLTSRVAELKELNETMRHYLEEVIRGINPAKSDEIIRSEQKRLWEIEKRKRIESSPWWEKVSVSYGVDFDDFLDAIKNSHSIQDFAKRISKSSTLLVLEDVEKDVLDLFRRMPGAKQDLNELRELLGVSAL